MSSPLVFFQLAVADPAATHAFLDELFGWEPAAPDDPGSAGRARRLRRHRHAAPPWSRSASRPRSTSASRTSGRPWLARRNLEARS